MTGKGSVNHNDRKFTAENVDKERTQNNITYCNENIRTVYHKLFDDAVKDITKNRHAPIDILKIIIKKSAKRASRKKHSKKS